MERGDFCGVNGLLLGFAGLVMVGVAITGLIDRRGEFSTASTRLKAEVQAGAEKVAALEARRQKFADRFAGLDGPARTQAQEKEELQRRKTGQQARIAGLRADRESLERQLEALRLGFATYRVDYRRQAWSDAVGEKLPQIALRNGRVFHGVTISRVSEAGLEVSHEGGLARIECKDLDVSWQDRFQWTDDERAGIRPAPVRVEEVVQAPPVREAPRPAPPPKPSPRPVQPSPPSPPVTPGTRLTLEERRKLKEQVDRWQWTVDDLQQQYQNASASAGRSSTSRTSAASDPQLAQIAARLSQARIELAGARARLAHATSQE